MTFVSDLLHLINTQIKIEKQTVKKVRDLEGLISNLAAKLLLVEMRFDTEKHAKMSQTLLELSEKREADKTSKKFWQTETSEYVDALNAKGALENHVAVERTMLEQMKKMVEITDDSAMKMVFRHILEDEKKHHEIMEAILEKAFKIVSLP